MIGCADHGGECDLRRHAGLGTPPSIAGPALGQVERPIDQRVALRAGIGQEHPDLAVLDPARRARILPLHADRVRALLQKAGLIQHQHSIRIAKMLDDIGPQVVANLLGVPAHAAEEVLHSVGRGVASGLGQLPAVLALDRGQQSAQLGQGAAARLDPGEARRERRAQLLQLRRPSGRVL
jgi:hypothetical protein